MREETIIGSRLPGEADGLGLHEELPLWYLGTSTSRFGGGANDIHRDIIAQQGLGLPR